MSLLSFWLTCQMAQIGNGVPVLHWKFTWKDSDFLLSIAFVHLLEFPGFCEIYQANLYFEPVLPCSCLVVVDAQVCWINCDGCIFMRIFRGSPAHELSLTPAGVPWFPMFLLPLCVMSHAIDFWFARGKTSFDTKPLMDVTSFSSIILWLEHFLAVTMPSRCLCFNVRLSFLASTSLAFPFIGLEQLG